MSLEYDITYGMHRLDNAFKTSNISMLVLNDRILLTPIKPNDLSAGGIYIPQNAQKEKFEGRVVEIGLKVTKETTDLLGVGDVVTYGEYSAQDLEIDGQDYLFVKEADILFIHK